MVAESGADAPAKEVHKQLMSRQRAERLEVACNDGREGALGVTRAEHESEAFARQAREEGAESC